MTAAGVRGRWPAGYQEPEFFIDGVRPVDYVLGRFAVGRGVDLLEETQMPTLGHVAGVLRALADVELNRAMLSGRVLGDDAPGRGWRPSWRRWDAPWRLT